MITKIFLLCATIHLINGQQTGNAANPQSDEMYVFDLPPLQVKPLQIRVKPSYSTLFLIRQNDKQEMEFIPIDQYDQEANAAVSTSKQNQNQVLSQFNNLVTKSVPQTVSQAFPQPLPQMVFQAFPQPLPQGVSQALPQPAPQAKPKVKLPKESSVEYDEVPSVQSVLKDLSSYVPYQLPDFNLLYQQSTPAQKPSTQSLAPQAQTQNTRSLPSITLPALTLPANDLPVQTIAVELPPQTLPVQTVTASQILQALQASTAQTPQVQNVQTQTLQTETVAAPAPEAQPVQDQTVAAPAPEAQQIQAQQIQAQPIQAQQVTVEALPAPVPTAQPQRIETLVLPQQAATVQPQLSNGLQNQQVFFFQTFAEAGKAASLLAPLPTAAPTIKPITPTLRPNIKSSFQKPITTEIRRTFNHIQPQFQTLALTQPQILTPIQTIQTQTQSNSLNNPSILLFNNNQPFSFGFDFTDASGNQQSRKEEISANGAVTGNYKYTDANGLSRHVQYIADENGFRAGIGTNEPGTSGLSSAGVKVNSKQTIKTIPTIKPTIKSTKKPIVLQPNKSAAVRKISFTQKHHS